jgi:hypothetical protein
MNREQDDILTRRLDALGRGLSTDIGPVPAELVTASNAMVQQRVERWSFAGLAMAASVLIALGGLAIWGALNSGHVSKLAGNSQAAMVPTQPANDAADGNETEPALASNGQPAASNGTSDSTAAGAGSAGVPTMGDLRGAVNDPVAGDPRLGGSLSPKY